MDSTTPSSVFERIGGRNVVAGTHVSGQGILNVTFNNSDAAANLPSVGRSTIPFPRNEDIVNRAHIFAELDRLLPHSGRCQSAALWGLGGSGKTQIALEYAYRRSADPSCSIFWVHADTETTFAQDYQSVARKLGLTSSLKGAELLEAVRDRIEAEHRWLLVLDNADDLRLFGVRPTPSHSESQAADAISNLNDFVPRGTTGTVLWTSRDRHIGGTLVGALRAINVGRMTDPETRALFVTDRDGKVGDDETGVVGQLFAELDWLPLAISQAAAYIRRTSTPIRKYLAKIQNRKTRWTLLQKTEADRHRRPEVSNSVLETWDISVEHIRQDNKLAYHILHSLAFLDSQRIPFELIRRISGLQDRGAAAEAAQDDRSVSSIDESDETGEEDEELIEAITRLQEFSFLHLLSDQAGRAYEMHKLVQDATRHTLRKKQRQEEEAYFSATAFQAIENPFPKGEPELRRKLWDECGKYLTHAQRVGEWAELCKVE